MFKRLRTTWLAGGGALLLVLSLSGVVAGASFLAATGPAQETADPEVVVDTTATFEDTNGNGIDDDCEEGVVADPVAAAAAEAAADVDGNGVISVPEAAHSGRTGGKNCNHGGYVSGIAHGDDACEAPETTEPEVTDPGETDTDAAIEADEAVAEEPGGDDADETDTDEPDADESEDCASASEDQDDGETVVSAAAKAAAKEAKAAAREARKAEHDAAKAERKAAHDAAKAERAAAKAERAAAKAERQAAKAEKASKEKANGNGH